VKESRNITYTKDSQVDEAITRYSSQIKKIFGGSIQKIILFGSYARGEARLDSDVDILVVTTDETFDTQYTLIGMGYDIYTDMGVFLSVKVRSAKNFEKFQSSSFLQTISHEGVLVG
jgi:uncharacterized protein